MSSQDSPGKADTGATSLPADDGRAALRRAIYAILITVGIGAMLGRIFAVDSIDVYKLEQQRVREIDGELKRREAELRKAGRSDEQIKEKLAQVRGVLEERSHLARPFLSGNDRSRWCTLRALVEPDMQVEGAPYAIDKVIQQQNWDTIDMVKHDHRYTPPEGPLPHYKPNDRIKPWDGQQIGGHLYSSKPPLYPTLLAGVYWIVYKATGETLGTQPYFVGRIILVAANVLPMIVYWIVVAWLIERFGRTDWARMFAMAVAVFATFLTTFSIVLNNHLPGAVSAAIVLWCVARIWNDGQRVWWHFALAGLFSGLLVMSELPGLALAAIVGVALLFKAPRPTLIAFAPAAALVAAGFFGTNWLAHGTLKPPYSHRASEDSWYNYTYIVNGQVKESYWTRPSEIDLGERDWPAYALHVLVGHHGIFSLTPVWILTVIGLGAWLAQRQDRGLRELALLIAAVSLACIVFYLWQPQVNRNYGGMTAGLRWLFWLAPLWIVGLLPAADWFSRCVWARGLALAALAVSVLSVSYPTWNPWTHPWLMNYLYYTGVL